jgi:hypothetical protein
MFYVTTKVGTTFANKRRSLGRYSLLADQSPRRFFFCSMVMFSLSLSPNSNQERRLLHCLSKHRSMETFGRVVVRLRTFSTSALDGSEWLASCHPLFYLRGKETCLYIAPKTGCFPESVSTLWKREKLSVLQ